MRLNRLPPGALAWAFYDWAASAYALCMLAAFFPIILETYWAAGLSPAQETF
ncbi:MAG: hypothetical protein P8Q97_05775 [Myxococcota bacterium]|nr:hypothetical protein [Myxococcota bacterium]